MLKSIAAKREQRLKSCMVLSVSLVRIICYYGKILMLQDVHRSIVCRVAFVNSVRKATLCREIGNIGGTGFESVMNVNES